MEGHTQFATLNRKVDDILDIVIFLKDSMGAEFQTVHKRLDSMDQRMDNMDDQFEKMDRRFGSMDARMDESDSKISYLSQDMKEVKVRLTRIETKVDEINARSLEDTDSLARDVAGHEVRISRLEKYMQ